MKKAAVKRVFCILIAMVFLLPASITVPSALASAEDPSEIFFITGSFSNPNVYRYWWIGPTSGGWTHELVGNVVSGGCRAATMADYDNDGDLDFTMANTLNEVYLFINNGGGIFTRSLITTLPAGQISHDACAADFDNDGDYDFCLALDSDLLVFTNDGNANFAPFPQVIFIPYSITPPIHGMEALEKDPYRDIPFPYCNKILFVDDTHSTIYVIWIDISAGIAMQNFTLGAPAGHGVAVGDIYMDGTMDIVAHTTGGEGLYYQNSASGFDGANFNPPVVIYDTGAPYGLNDMYSFDLMIGSEDTEATGYNVGVYFVPNSLMPPININPGPDYETAIAAPPLKFAPPAKVPALTPIGFIALIGILTLLAIWGIKRK